MTRQTKPARIMDDLIFDPFDIASLPKPSIGPTPKMQRRFRKIGPNANHQLTVDMRNMKNRLGITTRELVDGLREFEKEFGLDRADEQGVAKDYMPMSPVLMSSYLQGWVLQDAYMEAVHARIKRLYKHRIQFADIGQKALAENGLRNIFNQWFEDLGIPNNGETSPIRTFARTIAPYYKRAVTAKHPGVFRLEERAEGLAQRYTITPYGGDPISDYLNWKEEVLVKSGTAVKRGDILQYSVLYRQESKGGKCYFNESAPSEDHTTFYRWLTAKKPPRASAALSLVEAAVKAAKAAKESEMPSV